LGASPLRRTRPGRTTALPCRRVGQAPSSTFRARTSATACGTGRGAEAALQITLLGCLLGQAQLFMAGAGDRPAIQLPAANWALCRGGRSQGVRLRCCADARTRCTSQLPACIHEDIREPPETVGGERIKSRGEARGAGRGPDPNSQAGTHAVVANHPGVLRCSAPQPPQSIDCYGHYSCATDSTRCQIQLER
jgi:hypothetical protein